MAAIKNWTPDALLCADFTSVSLFVVFRSDFLHWFVSETVFNAQIQLFLIYSVTRQRGKTDIADIHMQTDALLSPKHTVTAARHVMRVSRCPHTRWQWRISSSVSHPSLLMCKTADVSEKTTCGQCQCFSGLKVQYFHVMWKRGKGRQMNKKPDSDLTSDEGFTADQ